MPDVVVQSWVHFYLLRSLVGHESLITGCGAANVEARFGNAVLGKVLVCQLFLQKLGPMGAYPLQVFNWI